MILENLDKLHTTELGIIRIKRSLNLEVDDVVDWCKQQVKKSGQIIRRGKNWYIYTGKAKITVNANNYSIITAHPCANK